VVPEGLSGEESSIEESEGASGVVGTLGGSGSERL
jgi:hypothetical protein